MINTHAINHPLRLLVKFGYIGWLYTGYQTGNGNRSVEDTILEVLRKKGISDGLHSAARTDRSVSAISNAIAIDTSERPSKVMGILNSSIPGMLFHSYAIVDDDFNPRHCDFKIYRYIIPEEEAGPYLRRSLALFRGRHDFSNFCKLDERNPVRTIRSIRVSRKEGMISVDFKSRSFLWNQIRTIMAYALDHSFSQDQEDPFSLKERYGRLLDPEALLLQEMVYDGVEFRQMLSLSKIRQFQRDMKKSRIRNRVLDSFGSAMQR